MKFRRGLSSVVGTVFLIAIVISALSYVSYSIDTMGNFSELLITEESRISEKHQESFEIVSIEITAADKLDGVIKNTGEIPLKLTTLWIDEQGANEVVQKFSLNSDISPGYTVNLINLIDYTVDPNKGYNMKIVSSRGEVKSFFVNSPNQQPLDLQLYALPETIPDEFESTILLSVHNNGTGDDILMNITPNPIEINPLSTTVTYVNGPIPSSYPSLKSGDTAIFKWTYSVDGMVDDVASFNATLENGYVGNFALTQIKVGEVKLSTEALTSFSAQGFNPLSSQTQDLLFHQENLSTAGLTSAYQMDQRLGDAAGLDIHINATTPDFYTNNGTAVRIEPGNWNASLTYRSAPFPDSLDTSMNAEGGMIFHFEDAGVGIDGNEDNSFNCVNDPVKTKYATYAGTMSAFDWSPFDGPHGSGSYSFDGTGDYFSVERSKCNDLKTKLGTISGWFKSNGGSGDDYIYWAGKDDNGGNNVEHFAVRIDNGGNVVFDFKTANSLVACVSSGTNYRDNVWHHFVGVRDGNFSCKLYLDGNTTPISSSGGSGDPDIGVDKPVLIGARLLQKDVGTGTDFFQGSLDDIMYWHNFAMSAASMSELYNTNYGNAAHQILFTFEETDDLGLNPRTIDSGIYPMNFSDGKRSYQALSTFNHTISPGLQEIDAQNRLHFTIADNSGLNMTLRIDDNTFTTNPENSYLDLPNTNSTFFPFNSYDNDSELTAGITNDGPYGAWLTKSGTRAILNNTSNDLSYGAIIKSVNGTILDENHDGPYVGVGKKIDLIFHRPNISPNNCWPPGPSCDVGLIPAGMYKGSILINGYNDQGNENIWKIDMGNLNVND